VYAQRFAKSAAGDEENMARGRPRTWTPKAIPFGLLIALLGAWVFFVPLVGPYFRFGFDTHSAWEFTGKQWELQLAPGIAAFVGGLMLVTPQRGWGRPGAALAFLAGAWLIVGPAFYPVFSSGTVSPYGSEIGMALRWVGHFYGAGGLILYFAGYAHGLFTRRTLIQEVPVAPEPTATTRTVVPEQPVTRA
jgi:hypothetical protein